MVMYAYLEGARYDRVVIAKWPRLTWTGIVWDNVYGTRVADGFFVWAVATNDPPLRLESIALLTP